MYPARNPFLLLGLTLLLCVSARGQESPEIEVTNVRFDRVAGDWISASVEIRADKNPLPDAIDEDYLDDVRLTLFVCYEVDAPEGGEGFSFYRSTVRIVSLESTKVYALRFFLPEVVRDRDDLDVDPFAWVIEMEASGVPVALRDDQFGGEIKSQQAYDSFLSKANSEGADNDGILLPLYLAPDFVVNESRVNPRDVPAFYRFEPEN